MSNKVSRRSVLKSSAAAAGVAAGASLCTGCAIFGRESEDLVADPKSTTIKIPLATYPQLKAKAGFIRVEAMDGDKRLLVFRSPSGEVKASDMVCTHWGCDVDYAGDKGEIVCDCHGSRFDLAGKVLEGPAEDPLMLYPVTEEGDMITVDLSRTV